MKKCGLIFFVFFLLTGCSGTPAEMETALELRSRLLQSQACSFDASITADYGNKIHTFSMHCQSDDKGDLSFIITEPETISGIGGKISSGGGRLTFEDTALYFELIAEDQLSPVSAPWILMRTLRSGYITSSCREDDSIRISVDDGYEQDPICLDIWLNSENEPGQADILYDGRRILSVAVDNFEIQ